MTLVLSALAPRHIVQVSDRRVVLRYPSGAEVKRDGHVKAVVTRRFACSYTGLAAIGGDTADWLAIHLADHWDEVDGGIESLSAAAEREIADAGLFGQELTIVCVGWWGQPTQPLAPMATVVTNRGAQGIQKKFNVFPVAIANGRRSAVFAVGQPMNREELASVNRSVERLCDSNRDTARSIAHVLTEAIRAVSASANRSTYVSEDVLVTSLPHLDLVKDTVVVGTLVEDFWSVTNIPAGSERKERHGGPIIVGRKAAIQALPPEEGIPGPGVSSAARCVRLPEDDGALEAAILTDPPLGPAWGWPG